MKFKSSRNSKRGKTKLKKNKKICSILINSSKIFFRKKPKARVILISSSIWKKITPSKKQKNRYNQLLRSTLPKNKKIIQLKRQEERTEDEGKSKNSMSMNSFRMNKK